MHQTTAIILQLFRKHDCFLSGEQISKELGVSRTAVWKHISTLREQGYKLEALPSRGYRLCSTPDILTEAEISSQLKSVIIGKKIVSLKVTTSTNREAFNLAEKGAEQGTIVIAEEQSAGKGRMGRVWTSPAAVNLYCSIILRPLIKPYQAAQLTFLSAVATARAIEQTSNLKPSIKWPNDLLIGERKVAGLLNEMSAETDITNFVILGIGVNLNMRAEQFPADLRTPATSLYIESGVKTARAKFTALLLTEMDKLYQNFLEHGFSPVQQEWQSYCNANGRKLLVDISNDQQISGMFAGLDNDGALLVRVCGGKVERIISGDVRII